MSVEIENNNNNHTSLSVNQQKNEKEVDTSCCICLIEKMVLPQKLDCGHQMCYLCIKQESFNKLLCPLCRQPFLESKLNEKDPKSQVEVVEKDVWFYSGKRNGWWMFDPITNDKIEELYHMYLQNKFIYNPENNPIKINGFGTSYYYLFDKATQLSEKGDHRKIARGKSNVKVNIKGMAGKFSDIVIVQGEIEKPTP